jgi:hypothetical protein
MATRNVRRSFIIFHLVLGLGLLFGSSETLLHALGNTVGHSDHAHLHLAIVAGLEGLGAVLFLLPRTLRVGGILLLITILGAWAVHSVRGEWRFDLLIYAAGTWFVMVHGAEWGARPAGPDGAA